MVNIKSSRKKEIYFRMTSDEIIKLSILLFIIMPVKRGEHFPKSIWKLFESSQNDQVSLLTYYNPQLLFQKIKHATINSLTVELILILPPDPIVRAIEANNVLSSSR